MNCSVFLFFLTHMESFTNEANHAIEAVMQPSQTVSNMLMKLTYADRGHFKSLNSLDLITKKQA